MKSSGQLSDYTVGWREIEQLVEEIASLSRSDIPTHDFYACLLDKAVQATAAAGGAIWVCDEEDSVKIAHQIGVKPIDQHIQRSRREAVNSTLMTFKRHPMQTSSRFDRHGQFMTLDSGDVIFVVPFGGQSSPDGVVDIIFESGMLKNAEENLLQILESFCELAGDFQERQELRRLRNREESNRLHDRFRTDIHRSLNVDSTAFAIANDGRLAIGCDRVSVLVGTAKSLKTVVMSGVDSLVRRTELCRSMERLGECVATAGEVFLYSGDAQGIAPQVSSVLDNYLDRSHAKQLAIVPLFDRVPLFDVADGEERKTNDALLVGALIAENFTSIADQEAFGTSVAEISRHAAVALSNSLRHERMPLMSLSRQLQRISKTFKSKRTNWLVACLLFTSAVTFLCLAPARLEIEARGELQPVDRRDVFAVADAIVHQIHFKHGEAVVQDDVLVELTKPELEQSISRVTGELSTLQQGVQSIRAKRFADTDGVQNQEGQLAAEEEQLRKQVDGLKQQQAVLFRQRDALRIRSPIDGKVLSWNVDQLFAERPVKRGQKLMTVAHVSGPWMLDLKVSDKDISYVLNRQTRSGSNSEVSFILGTDAGTTHFGEIDQIASTTDFSKQGEFVRVTVNIDPQDIDMLRPGATVFAKIDCGHRALGYVLFRDLWHTIQTRLLF